MVEALVISNIVLWIAVIILSILLLALTRQVGILYERVAPAGALMPTSGPKAGEMTKPLNMVDLAGNQVTIGGINDSAVASFILFVSPTCPVCKSLVPTAKALVKSESHRMRLILASDGDELASHQTYAKEMNLNNVPYVISEQLGRSFEVSKLPFAVLIAADGTLKSKGLVNTREHMESLIESMDSGITSVQEYIGHLEDASIKSEQTPTPMEHTS
jgi:methylamine dehydrogenase accessory protein MauD